MSIAAFSIAETVIAQAQPKDRPVTPAKRSTQSLADRLPRPEVQ